jgi:hypothetical protein
LSDLKYGGAIMQHLAEFERKQCNGKKVIFFFSQAEAFEDCMMDDIAKWYFGMKHEIPIFGSSERYAKMFKTRDGVVEHQGNITAIVYMLQRSALASQLCRRRTAWKEAFDGFWEGRTSHA